MDHNYTLEDIGKLCVMAMHIGSRQLDPHFMIPKKEFLSFKDSFVDDAKNGNPEKLRENFDAIVELLDKADKIKHPGSV